MHHRFKYSRLVPALPFAAAAVVSVAPHSATAEPAATPSQLEEVLVTARKREETVLTVPVAVSAINAAQIQASMAQSTRDLENISPNLIIDAVQATPGGAAISVRGVSFQDLEKSFDPAVGVVVDGIYLGTNTGAMLQVFDLERIEVLRGPQGTLFGKNTIGGTINVIRSRPTGEWDAKMRLRVGDYDRQEFDAVLNFPIISDKLAAKLTFTDREQDGWYDNIAPEFGGEPVGNLKYREYGGALRYTPTDTLTIDYSYYKQADDSDAAPLLGQNGPTDLFCLPLTLIFGPDPYVPPGQCAQSNGKPLTGDFYKVAQNFSDTAYLDQDAHTFSVNWGLSESWTLDYLFGYMDASERVDQDFDATPVNQFSTRRVQEFDQMSHELRLSYDAGGRFDIVGGAYYWDSSYQLGQTTFFLYDVLAGITPALAGLKPGRPITQLQATDHSNESWALFAEMDFNITDAWTLTLGGRYTDEKKEFERAAALNLGGFPAAIVGPVLPSPPFGTTFVSGSPVYPKPTGAVLPQFSTFGNQADESWSEFSPKAGIRWIPNEETMMYLTYTSGFRSGGFNGRAGALSSATVTYDPETVDTLELGYKAHWLENRVQFNAAVFFGKYDNKQEEIVTPLPNGDQETLVQNASEADINGAELEIIMRLTDAWDLRTNIGYLDASYSSFCADVDGPSAVAPPQPLPNECGDREQTGSGWIIPTDNSDLELRRAPEWTFSVDTSYTWDIGPGALTAQAAYNWRDDYYTTFQNVPLGLTEAYGLLDASLAYETDHWRFTVFGRNLTDELYVNSGLVVAGLFNFQTVGPPRQYGAEVTYRFRGE